MIKLESIFGPRETWRCITPEKFVEKINLEKNAFGSLLKSGSKVGYLSTLKTYLRMTENFDDVADMLKFDSKHLIEGQKDDDSDYILKRVSDMLIIKAHNTLQNKTKQNEKHWFEVSKMIVLTEATLMRSSEIHGLNTNKMQAIINGLPVYHKTKKRRRPRRLIINTELLKAFTLVDWLKVPSISVNLANKIIKRKILDYFKNKKIDSRGSKRRYGLHAIRQRVMNKIAQLENVSLASVQQLASHKSIATTIQSYFYDTTINNDITQNLLN